MAEGFKVADAYADFHLDVDKAVQDAARRLKTKAGAFDGMGREAGKAYGKGFRSGLDLTGGVDSQVKLVKSRGNQFARAGGTAGEGYARGFKQGANLRGSMSEQVGVVKSARPAFGREGKLAGEAYARGFGGQKIEAGTATVRSGGGGDAAGKALGDGVVRGYRQASKGVDKVTEQVAARSQAKFQGLKWLALSQGLPAAAAVGALGVTAALAGVSAVFGGLAVAAVAQNDKVQQSFTTTANKILDDFQGIADPLEDDVVGAIEDVGRAWTQLTPQVAAATQASAKGIRYATTAAIGFAQNAMPGIVAAVKASEPAWQGLDSLSRQAGRGVSEFFANASEGSVAAGQGMETFGGTLRMVEARAGTLLAQLANGSAGPLRSFHATADLVTGTLLDMTAAGSGVTSFLGGFSTAGNGALVMLRGIVGGLSALPAPVASFAGSMGAASLIMSQFGVNAARGFDGFADRVRAAETPAKRMGAIVGGLAQGAFHPAMLAVVGLGLVLDTLGKRQEQAAEKARQHAENVRGLTDAIRADKGELGAHAEAFNLEALNAKNAANNLQAFGSTLGVAKLAIQGNSQAYEQLRSSANGRIEQMGKEMGLSGHAISSLQGLTDQMLKNGGAYKDVKGAVDQFTRTTDANGVATSKMTAAHRTAFDAIFNATGAVGEQMRAQQQAHDVYVQTEQAITGLTAAQITQRDATTQATQAIYAQQDAQLGYRGSVLATKEATDQYNKVQTDGTATALQKEQALLGLERAYAAQEQAAYQASYATNADKTENERASIAIQAMNAETLKLAGSLKGPLPASMQTTINSMSAAQLRAGGATVSVNGLNQAVVTLPGGKTITLKAETAAAVSAVQDLKRSLDLIQSKTVTVTTSFVDVGNANTRSQTSGYRAYADGGIHEMDGRTVIPNANGNIIGMASGMAAIAPPSTPRLIGDNPKSREFYIPDNNSPRSKAILGEANESFGVEVNVPAPPPINITINPPPDVDLNALAEMVSRRIELARGSAA